MDKMNEAVLPEEVPGGHRHPNCYQCGNELHSTDTTYSTDKGYCCYVCYRQAESKKFHEIMKPLKDSGKRIEFATGAVRDGGEGKGRFDLVPPYPMDALSKHFEKGCLKYGERNFEKGIPLGEYLDSFLRHVNQWRMGLRDEPHLLSGLWNLWNLINTINEIKAGRLPPSLDDNHYMKEEDYK